jgi:predicted phosphate transport protein (TIGR00153 family)
VILFRSSFKIMGRKERRVLRLLDEHLEAVLEAVNNLKSLISILVEENPQILTSAVIEENIEMISIYESSADDIYLQSLITLCEGAFFSGLREDFIKLFESIDDIADFSKDSSQIIARSKLDSSSLKMLCEKPEASLGLYMEKIVGSVNALREAVKELERDVDQVIKKSIEVKAFEEEADDIKSRLIEIVYSRRAELDILTLLELKELVLTLDEIADAAERSSETLLIIVTKARA